MILRKSNKNNWCFRYIDLWFVPFDFGDNNSRYVFDLVIFSRFCGMQKWVDTIKLYINIEENTCRC